MSDTQGTPETDDAEAKPRLRPVDAFPVENEGARMIAVRDSQGISPAQILLSPQAFFLVAQFDGTHTIRDVQASFVRKFGELLPAERIREVVDRLEEALLLEGPKFEAHLEGQKAAFKRLEVRPPAHAGASYEAQKEALGRRLDGLFEAPGGPGTLRAGRRPEPLRAMIAPHIDLARGSGAYAAAWREAAEGPAPDAVVILGTAHAGHHEGLYVGTRKRFETPLGTSPVDGGILDALEKAAGPGLYEEEYLHAGEHSVEFQVLFLQRFLGMEVPVVPLLVCSFHEFVVSGREPSEDERVGRGVEALRQSAGPSGRRVLLLASADLAHVGPRFGDSQSAEPFVLAGLERQDMELMKRASAVDAGGFFEKIARAGDRTRVCGFPGIYTMLRVLEGEPLRGVLRKYGNTVDPGGSAVTFAGMTFEPA